MTGPTHAVALVEDDALLRDMVSQQIALLGYEVEAFENAAGLYRHMATHLPMIVILDIGLPGEDGLSICRYLRENNTQIGIVFLTGRSERDDRLAGLASGADAYLVKPVDLDELGLVLRRLTERFESQAAQPATSAAPPPPVPRTGWQLAPHSGHLITPGQDRIRLSVNEMHVFKAILNKAGQVCSYDELVTVIGTDPAEVSRHRVEVIVSRLRAKVERECGLSLPIKSARGQGYVLEQPKPPAR